jgi:uncharacterized protein YciI
MLVLFNCLDNDNQQQRRLNSLKAHLDWVEHNMGSIKVAGPQLSEQTNTIVGSMYILEAESIEQAFQLLKSDPYHKADIWQKILITEFKDYAGTWVGGKNWPNA